MRELTTIGIDLAKNVFAVHAVDRDGRVVLRRLVGRGKLAELIAQLPPSLIGMESCTGAHEWAAVSGAGSFRASDGTDVCGAISQERQERR